MKTETVRVFDQYAFDGKWIREVLKQLDPTNIKILSAMAQVGPRNLLEVSRLTGIPFTTVYHRVEQIESKSGEVADLVPNVARLGITRIMVLVAAKPGLEDLVTEALRIPNYWRIVERCEGAFTHHSIQIIPNKFLNEFREYVSTMRVRNLIKSFRIVQTGDARPMFPDFSSYECGSGEWVFNWDGWLNLVRSAVPTSTIQDPTGDTLAAERVDLEIIGYLEQNARMRFTDLADKVKVSPQTVRYRYDRLVAGGVAGTFGMLAMPYPPEVASWHEFMLEFPDAGAMNRFYSVSKKLFFVVQVAKALHKNTLLVQTMLVGSQVENVFAFFAEMVNAGQLTTYSAVRLNTGTRFKQTISFELFDPVNGWRWDVYKNLLELNKL